MLSNNTNNTELTIYTAYINNNVLSQFTPVSFRQIDSSDVPGVALKVFSFLVGIIGGAHLYKPFTNTSMPNIELLSMSLSSVKALSNRGKVIIPSDKFPHIAPLYVMADVADWIKISEENLLEPKFNPFYRNGLTYIPTLKNDWSVVYITSLCSPQEFEKNGLDHGYITLTRNDAIQLCELIIKGEYPPPLSPSMEHAINDDHQLNEELVTSENKKLTKRITVPSRIENTFYKNDDIFYNHPVTIPPRIENTYYKNDDIFYNSPNEEASENCVLNKNKKRK